MNVGYLMVEKNPRVGDNWALRYDSLKFHVPTSLCETPFLGEYLLSRKETRKILLVWVLEGSEVN